MHPRHPVQLHVVAPSKSFRERIVLNFQLRDLEWDGKLQINWGHRVQINPFKLFLIVLQDFFFFLIFNQVLETQPPQLTFEDSKQNKTNVKHVQNRIYLLSSFCFLFFCKKYFNITSFSKSFHLLPDASYKRAHSNRNNKSRLYDPVTLRGIRSQTALSPFKLLFCLQNL